MGSLVKNDKVINNLTGEVESDTSHIIKFKHAPKFMKLYYSESGVTESLLMDGESARLLLYLLFDDNIEYGSGRFDFSKQRREVVARIFGVGVATLYRRMSKLVKRGFVNRGVRGRYEFNRKYFEYGQQDTKQ